MKYLMGSAVMAGLLASAYASPLVQEEGNPMVNTALQFLARASSTSEVLTLNLTNLLILIVLKGIVIAVGLFSFGGSTARSSDGAVAEPMMSQADLTGGMCFMMYTSGDYEKLACVQRTACEEPRLAKKYLMAGKMWHNMHKMFDPLPFSGKYVEVMSAVEDAVAHNANGGDCAVYPW